MRPLMPRFAQLRRLARDRRGNVLMIFGLSLVPLTFATGMAIDYGSAMRLQTELNAAADAATLAATSAAMMDKSLAEATNQAKLIFKTQSQASNGIAALNYDDPAQVMVTVTETMNADEGMIRTATVTYHAKSKNSFAGVLGSQTLGITGTATARATQAPNIDFYVMLDASSSMALPTTTSGINFLKSKTKTSGNPNGCAFACHQSNPDNPKIKDSKGKMIDYYTFAHNNGIELRIDAGKDAIGDMVTEAQKESASNGATYRFYLATFELAKNYRELTGSTPLTDYSVVRAKAATAETVAVEMHAYMYDRQTEHADSLGKMNAAIKQNPGNGMRSGGNTPQAVLFLITDGMRDEEKSGRQIGPITADQCTTIKARGVRIAVLYTTYQVESINYDPWSVDNVVWRLPQIAPALRSCASDGLFFEVSTDGNISQALNALFQKTIESSHLIR